MLRSLTPLLLVLLACPGGVIVSAGPDLAAAPDAGPAAIVDAGPSADAGPGEDAGPTTPPPLPPLVARGGRLELPDGGSPHFKGAISCCGGGYGWPLFDEAWVDYTAQRGVTFLHARLGPFLTGPDGESDWATVGGGYVETAGKADLARFNEPFWARLRTLIAAAGARGQYVEVDVIDGWAIKHCRFGDLGGYSAWGQAYNLQDLDLCATAGSDVVQPGSEHERWIRKVVFETGRFDNVIYQDGNEVGLVPGYQPGWTTSMQQLIRDEEAAHGYARHLFGTNSGRAATQQAREVDYVELHQDDAAQAANCAGKPCLVNEYNPEPPLTPEQLRQRLCDAARAGTYFWYWRHGQSAEQMDQSLAQAPGACD